MHRSISSTLIALTLFAGNLLHAQTAAVTSIAPPVLPIATDYRYWPVQFVQWVGTELPYSMIELDVDPDGKHPLLYVTLTERATGKRIHYAQDEGLLASAAAQGEEAHKSAIGFEPADTDAPGSITNLRFTMADGKPLQWRFVQGTDISEQGSGLSPLPEAKLPIFAYREQAAVAGEGTALQIGDTVSTASVWTEISRPPYFVGYRGAESEGAHTLVFLPAEESWKVVSAPTALTVGATWELDGPHGDHRSMHIDKVDGAHITVTSFDRFEPRVRTVLEATRTGDAWSIDHVRFSPLRDAEKHSLSLQFATPFSAASGTTDLTLVAGKRSPIASGSIVAADAPAGHSLTLSFSNPVWLKGKTITEVGSPANQIVSNTHP